MYPNGPKRALLDDRTKLCGPCIAAIAFFFSCFCLFLIFGLPFYSANNKVVKQFENVRKIKVCLKNENLVLLCESCFIGFCLIWCLLSAIVSDLNCCLSSIVLYKLYLLCLLFWKDNPNYVQETTFTHPLEVSFYLGNTLHLMETLVVTNCNSKLLTGSKKC